MAAVASRTILPAMTFDDDFDVSEDMDPFTDSTHDEWVEPESEEQDSETNSNIEGSTSAEESKIEQQSNLSESVIISTTTTTDFATEDAFDQRPPSPSSGEPPSMVLSFHSNLFHIFSLPSSDDSSDQSNNTGVLFSDKSFLYKSPLQSFMSELQTHFSIENDVSLDFPDLNLTFSTHMIYAQKVTLAHVHLLIQALQTEQHLPFRAILTELPNAFLKQYNHLIVLAQSRKDAYIRPLSPSASSNELPVPNSVSRPTISVRPVNVPIESSEEVESEDFTNLEVNRATETTERIETTDTEPSLFSNTDEILEEEVKFNDEAREGDQLDLGEEAVELEDSTPAEELDVEIEDINSDLVPPADSIESPYSPSLKPHARHYEEEEGENELARKRPRFASPVGSEDTTAEEALEQL